MRTVIKIEADPILSKKRDEYRKKRVDAYCRISTDKEDQLNSLNTQIQYYSEKPYRRRRAISKADEGL